MKKCIIYGNCQAEALKHYLGKTGSFKKSYLIVALPAVHLLNDTHVSYLEKEVSEVDLFIHQPIADNYKGINELGTEHLKSLLKPGAIAFSFPSIYFKGYNPELMDLKLSTVCEGTKLLPYYDKFMIKQLLEGNSSKEIHDTITNRHLQCSELTNSYDRSFNELKRRECELTFIISDIIEEYGRKERLFHVYNHPTNRVLTILANRILTKLFPDFRPDDKLGPDVLSRMSFPIYAAVTERNNFKFIDPLVYHVNGRSYLFDDYIKLVRNFLEKNRNNITNLDSILN